MSEVDRLRELGKQLPFEKPSAERREALRSSLLVAASQSETTAASTRRRWLLVGGGFAAGAVAAAAIALVVMAPRDPAPPVREAHARVDAPATASLEHTVTATASGTDEVVRVRAGVVRLAVPAVEPGDRVRMQTADAEVEGTGTYEVAVVDDRLARVTVTDGNARVKVRVEGRQQQVFLAAGQTWRPQVVTADVATDAIDLPPTAPPDPVPTPSAAAKPKPDAPRAASKPTASNEPTADRVDITDEPPRMPVVTSLHIDPAAPAAPKPLSATERHFQAGWALLRAGKAREAAVELGAAADAGGASEPLAQDARYFQAVALVRAGDARAAERVLASFLDAARTSLRRGRAAILLGKLLRDRGDVKAARAWFEVAGGDGDPAVAAAARAHLASLR